MSANELVLSIPPQEEEPPLLFLVEGREDIPEPPSRGAKGRESSPRRSGLESFHARTPSNQCSIGTPLVYPLREVLPADAQLSSTAAYQMKNFELFWVQLACSFLPGQSFQFVRAHFSIELKTHSLTNLPSADDALVYDLSPQRVEQTYTTTSKWNLSPNLKFTGTGFEAQLSGPTFEKTTQRETHAVFLTSFGLQEEKAGWSFSKTPSQCIQGSYRLFLLVKRPKQTRVSVIMTLSAVVERANLTSRVVMRYFDNRGTEVSTPIYPLC